MYFYLLNMATLEKGPESFGEKIEETIYTNTAGASLDMALHVLAQQ